MANMSYGNCYLCGKRYSKSGIKTHLLKAHNQEGRAKGILFKVVAKYNSNYWLYLDLSSSATLETLDFFLRHIWLECCGHMSAFSYEVYGDEIPMSTKLYRLALNQPLEYVYDYGSSTHLVVTPVAETKRNKTDDNVRVFARNEPPAHLCNVCGKPASLICSWCDYDENLYCEECAKKEDAEHYNDGGILPVTNSPRMGECAYSGEYDVYEFDPANVKASDIEA